MRRDCLLQNASRITRTSIHGRRHTSFGLVRRPSSSSMESVGRPSLDLETCQDLPGLSITSDDTPTHIGGLSGLIPAMVRPRHVSVGPGHFNSAIVIAPVTVCASVKSRIGCSLCCLDPDRGGPMVMSPGEPCQAGATAGRWTSADTGRTTITRPHTCDKSPRGDGLLRGFSSDHRGWLQFQSS